MFRVDLSTNGRMRSLITQLGSLQRSSSLDQSFDILCCFDGWLVTIRLIGCLATLEKWAAIEKYHLMVCALRRLFSSTGYLYLFAVSVSLQRLVPTGWSLALHAKYLWSRAFISPLCFEKRNQKLHYQPPWLSIIAPHKYRPTIVYSQELVPMESKRSRTLDWVYSYFSLLLCESYASFVS